MTNCPRATDASLASLAGGANRKQLRCLGLGNTPAVSEAGLVQLAAGCPSLTLLALNRCPGVTDGALEAIATHCTQLRNLDLSRADEFTEQGLLAVARGCKNLEQLVIEGCELDDLLTAEAALAVSAMPSLRCLYVGQEAVLCDVWSNLSEAAQQTLRRVLQE